MKHLIIVVFIALIVGNVYLFLQGIAVGENIKKYESGLTQLRVANIDLANQVNQISALNHLASVAAQMNFTDKQNLFYIKTPPVAYNK